MFWAATRTELPRGPLDDLAERQVRRADHHVVPGRRDPRQQRVDEGGRLGDRLVHLPVGRQIRRSAQASRNASTPGSFFPSSSSSEAPPPVETQSTRSARPNWWSAATESPPPTTVVPGRGGDGLGDGPGACRKRLHLEDPHRPVPEHRARLADRLGVCGCRGRADVEPHPAVGDLDPSLRRTSVSASNSSPRTRSVGRVRLAVRSLGPLESPGCELDALLLDQRVARGDALGAEEAEAHRAADQDRGRQPRGSAR